MRLRFALLDGYMPSMEKGDILGHEPMGEVVEIGSDVKKLKVGDRVVVPFVIVCGECFFCKKQLYSLCDTSNPGAKLARKAMGQATAGLFGYSHMTGGFAGGQAEYLRVPFADVGPFKIPGGIPDEKGQFQYRQGGTETLESVSCLKTRTRHSVSKLMIPSVLRQDDRYE